MGTCFRAPGVVLASGLVFGWVHVVVNNLVAVGLASLAGFVFASTYERSRSTLLVSIEHALYGDWCSASALAPLLLDHPLAERLIRQKRCETAGRAPLTMAARACTLWMKRGGHRRAGAGRRSGDGVGASSRRARVVEIDSKFGSQLGLDSLARVELLLRIQRRLGLTVPEAQALAAETPGELAAALRSAPGCGAVARAPRRAAGRRGGAAARRPPRWSRRSGGSRGSSPGACTSSSTKATGSCRSTTPSCSPPRAGSPRASCAETSRAARAWRSCSPPPATSSWRFWGSGWRAPFQFPSTRHSAPAGSMSTCGGRPSSSRTRGPGCSSRRRRPRGPDAGCDRRCQTCARWSRWPSSPIRPRRRRSGRAALPGHRTVGGGTRPIHLGQHGRSEGGRPHARQPHREHPSLRGGGRGAVDRCIRELAAALS